MGIYTDATSLRNFTVNCDVVDFGACTDPQLEQKIAVAEEIITNFTGHKFNQTADVIRLNGLGTHQLFTFRALPEPIFSISKVEYVDSDFNVIEDLGIVGYFYDVGGYAVNKPLGLNNSSTRSIQSDSAGYWIKGYENYRVTGVFGPATVPVTIVEATSLLAINLLKPGAAGLTLTNVYSKAWQDFTITYNSPQVSRAVEANASTGYLEIDRMLSNYLITPDLFNVIDDLPSHTRSGVLLIDTLHGIPQV